MRDKDCGVATFVREFVIKEDIGTEKLSSNVLLAQIRAILERIQYMSRGKYKKKRIKRLRREMLIRDADLPKRVVSILEEEEILTYADLDNKSEEELMAISGIGKKAMEAIRLIKIS